MKQACVVVVPSRDYLPLGQGLAAALGADLIQAGVHQFPDGELRVDINATVADALVCVLQSLATPVNEHLVQLMLLLNRLRHANRCRVLAVVPYFGYARQQQVARLGALHLFQRLLCEAGAVKVLSCDTHGIHTQNATAFPDLQHIQALPLFVQHIENRLNKHHIQRQQVVVVSPDRGGIHTAACCAARLGVDLAVINKKRLPSGQMQAAAMQGDLTNRRVAIILDDLIDTGQTLLQTATLLRKQHIPSVWAYATHALLTKPRPFFEQCRVLDSLVVTDTIPLSQQLCNGKPVQVLSCVPMLAQAIQNWLA